MEKVVEVANLLKVISNPNRLKILCVLESKTASVTELHEVISDISMAALSQHLAALKLSNLIEAKKVGMNVYYSLKDSKITKVMKVLREEYC